MSFGELNRIFGVNTEKGEKRVMRRFALDEISAVTNPAQKGARMTIMKRDDADADAAPFAKGQTVITSSTNGHAHLIVLDDYTLARGGGYTEEVAELVGERSRWHRHPFVIDKKGNITIGDADGHSHSVGFGETEKSASAAPEMPVQSASPDASGGFRQVAEIDGIRILRPSPGAGQPVEKMNAEAEFAKLAEEYARRNNVSLPVAYGAICETPEGARLYRETI